MYITNGLIKSNNIFLIPPNNISFNLSMKSELSIGSRDNLMLKK